jgi:hypothetical protein
MGKKYSSDPKTEQDPARYIRGPPPIKPRDSFLALLSVAAVFLPFPESVGLLKKGICGFIFFR